MMRIALLTSLLLSTLNAAAQTPDVLYFQRLLVDAEGQMLSAKSFEAALANQSGNLSNLASQTPFLTSRIDQMAQEISHLSKFHELFLEPVGPSPAQQLHFQSTPTQRDFSPKFMREIPLELLEQDHREAVATYPDLFNSFITLKRFVLENASQRLQQRNHNYQELEKIYSEKLSAIIEQSKRNDVPRDELILVLKAAQMPTIGFRSPPSPTLDPKTFALFEFLALTHLDISYKLELVTCMADLDDTQAAACMGLLLAQALYAESKGFQDRAFRTYMFQLLDFFKNHPNQPTALALSEAIALSDLSSSSYERYLSHRLDSPKWQRLIKEMSLSGRFREQGRTLGDLVSKTRRK